MNVKIAGLQKFSLIDYPGKVAAVIFTQGCNLRCPYCHNPQLVKPSFFQEPIPAEQILSFLESRKDKLQGVVVTGGEPTMQPDLIPLIEAIRTMGYQVKLDTNGTHPETLQKLLDLGLLDYVAMDLKSSMENYERAVGVRVNVDKIKQSMDLLLNSKIDYQFRTTVVKPVCDEDDLCSLRWAIDQAPCYRLQNFVASPDVLDPEILVQEHFSEKEFLSLQKQFQKQG